MRTFQPLLFPLAFQSEMRFQAVRKGTASMNVHGVLTVRLSRVQVLASEKQGRKLGRSPSRDYESKRAAGINPEADSP